MARQEDEVSGILDFDARIPGAVEEIAGNANRAHRAVAGSRHWQQESVRQRLHVSRTEGSALL